MAHNLISSLKTAGQLCVMWTELLFLLLSALTVNSRMFYFIPDNMTWSEAQTYCRSQYIDLATADNQAEYKKLEDIIPINLKTATWIGLFRTSAAGPWMWSDHSSFTFRLWGIGQPNNYGGQQFCVGTTLSGDWNDLECPGKTPSVCYTAKKKITARLEVKASQQLNHPNVKTEILEKIQQILNEKGLPEDAKLSWKIQSNGNVFQKNQKTEYAQTNVCSKTVKK